jgi:hypothetical protein
LNHLRLTGGINKIRYLFRDTFSADAAAPLDSPLYADVSGVWTVGDTENKLSKSGGKLNFAPNAVPDFVLPRLFSSVLSRSSGLAAIFEPTFTTTGKNSYFGFRGDNIYTPSIGTRIDGNTVAAYCAANGIALNVLDLPIKLSVVLQTSGFKLFGYSSGVWKLGWVDFSTVGSNLYFGMANYNATGTLDNLSVLQLPAPFNTDYGIATQRLAGARAAGDTFTHGADCLIEWTVTTLPSASSGIVRFRKQDSNNHWRVIYLPDGYGELQERVAGASTTRGSAAAGTFKSNSRVVVICDGVVIKVYIDNVIRITYSSATNFNTQTNGEVYSLGTGGAVSDIVSWPRRLSGTALAVMERYSK